MPAEHKIKQVAELEDQLNRSLIAISMDYRGLSVGAMQQLRRALREADPTNEMKVVKNTMLRRAADNAGKSGLMDVVEEATALVFGYTDEVSAAKALEKFARDSRLELTIRGGFLEGTVLSAADIAELAKTPGRIELMAKLAGGLNSPATGIAGGINSIMREVAAIVEARAAQLESDGGDAATPVEAEAAADDGGTAEAPADEEAPAGDETPADQTEADGEAKAPADAAEASTDTDAGGDADADSDAAAADDE